MRILLFIFVVFIIALTSCKSTETEPTQQQEPTEQMAISRNITTLDDAISAIVEALKNQDSTQLNKYINMDKGLYVILSGQGAYNQYIQYQSASPIFQYSEAASEYETNPLKFLMDYLNNVNMQEIEIVEEDLFGIDACAFQKEGFFLDSNQTDIKLLTDIYTINTTRNGTKINPTELVTLGQTQNEVSKTLYINDGEVTYTFYLTQDNGEWSVTIMDFKECNT